MPENNTVGITTTKNRAPGDGAHIGFLEEDKLINLDRFKSISQFLEEVNQFRFTPLERDDWSKAFDKGRVLTKAEGFIKDRNNQDVRTIQSQLIEEKYTDLINRYLINRYIEAEDEISDEDVALIIAIANTGLRFVGKLMIEINRLSELTLDKKLKEKIEQIVEKIDQKLMSGTVPGEIETKVLPDERVVFLQAALLLSPYVKLVRFSDFQSDKAFDHAADLDENVEHDLLQFSKTRSEENLWRIDFNELARSGVLIKFLELLEIPIEFLDKSQLN